MSMEPPVQQVGMVPKDSGSSCFTHGLATMHEPIGQTLVPHVCTCLHVNAEQTSSLLRFACQGAENCLNLMKKIAAACASGEIKKGDMTPMRQKLEKEFNIVVCRKKYCRKEPAASKTKLKQEGRKTKLEQEGKKTKLEQEGKSRKKPASASVAAKGAQKPASAQVEDEEKETYIYTYICICKYSFIYLCIYIYIYLFTIYEKDAWIYVCMYVCVYMHVYIYIYIYIYIL